jgi:ATP-binding cassette subfamily B protein
VLLDEATAALDSETEKHVQESLKRLSSGRTTLVIAHRLSTIKTANCILVLGKGEVIESGTHQELLATRARYAKMWQNHIETDNETEMEI